MENNMELSIDKITIINKIYDVRGYKVMLDFDLAEMYGVEARVLNQSVKRNIKRFPFDFMFQLTENEWESMSSQIVMTSQKRPKSAIPYAFTEHGVTMLSGILRSDIAIKINLQIVRAFVALRQYALGYAELNRKMEDFMLETNMQFNEVYQALTELAAHKKAMEEPRRPIGFVSQRNRTD